jgi:NADH-quinone oxidoreductase subunit J
MDAILFYVFAALALAGALLVIGQRNPIYSAFSLIVVFCSLSGIYGLLGSPFIATLQIVVYAGAIMVLFLFVLMLLNVKKEEPHQVTSPWLKASALVLCVLLVFQAGTVLLRAPT